MTSYPALRELAEKMQAHMGRADFQEVLNDGHACAKGLLDILDKYDAALAEITEANAQVDALSAKVDTLSPHGTCACSYDAPGDVCAHHSPALTAALAEIDRLREALKTADATLNEAENGYYTYTKIGDARAAIQAALQSAP
jgi:hypothetical protein